MRVVYTKLLFYAPILFLLSLLLVSSSFAVLQSESANLDILLDLPINFDVESGGSLVSLDIDFVMVPINDNRQSVVSSQYNLKPVSVDDGVAYFKVSNPSDFVLQAKYLVETSADLVLVNNKIDFPLTNVDSSLFKYISSSDVFDINSDISSLATDLSYGEDDLFKVVFYLADWTNKNIVYDLSTLNTNRVSASDVLISRRGVCTEYTSLFVSLVRSLGIPAREVSGIAFTDSNLFERGWEFHSWAEVYFPDYGWIPFDPTYGQYGFLDAGHVQLGIVSEDEIRKNSFSWRGRNVNVLPGKTDLNVNVLSVFGSRKKSRLIVDSSVLEKEVGLGSYNFLKVDLFNNNPFYVSENIRLAGVDGLTFLSPRTKGVVLAPYELSSVYFVFRVDRTLERGFIYTFPLVFYLNKESFSSSIKSREGGIIIFEDDVSMFLDDEPLSKAINCYTDSIVKLNNVLEINCGYSFEEGYLCFDNNCEFFKKEDSFVLFINMSEAGVFTKAVVFNPIINSSSRVAFINFMVLDDASLDLSNTMFSSDLNYSEISFINVSLVKNSSSIPLNVSLMIKHDYFEENFFIGDISDKFLFNFNFPASNLKKGKNVVLIEVSFVDSLNNEFSDYISLEINVSGLSFIDEIDAFFTKLGFWFKSLW